MNTINSLSSADKKYFKKGITLFCKTPKKGVSNALKVEKVASDRIKVRHLYDDLSESQEFNVYFKREIGRIRKYWIKSRAKAWGSYKPAEGG